jgi:C1A family cysteine protease
MHNNNICVLYNILLYKMTPHILYLKDNTQKNITLNYAFQTPDLRDYKFTPSINTLSKLTSKIPIKKFSLNQKNIIILDQGDLGSCVSNAFAQNINIMTNNTLAISRLYHYYCGRAISNFSSTNDTGLYIRSAASIISKYGAVKENIWAYNINNFTNLPPLNVFQNAKLFKKYVYTFINQNLNTLKACLIQNNSPIIFGIMVYSSFMTQSVTNTGNVPMPNTKTEQILGGHCVLMIGYNDITQTFLCVNSWGSNWGLKGFFNLPYAYVINSKLASDFCYLNFTY